MAKFQNTKHADTVTSLTESYKNRLNNPYYKFTDKKPFLVQYYNINTRHSTLDRATRSEYAILGDDSPIKYNLIKDAYLFGADRLQFGLDTGEFGLESDSLESESYILPDTWTPYPDDYFTINHSGKTYLFRVISVNMDTFDNGANFYKITWKYDKPNDDTIKEQVVETYRMILDNTGTTYKSILREESYDLIHELEILSTRLKSYYKSLFYKDCVQTFIYTYDGFNMYDPYLIEFLIRNKILSGSEYIYVAHQTFVPSTFVLTYDNTIFRGVEKKNKNKMSINTTGATMITDPNTLFSSRYEDYYCIDYSKYAPFRDQICIFDADFINRINNNIKFTDNNKLLNIIIDYFNEDEQVFSSDLFDSFDEMDILPNTLLYYCIPIIIYIIEKYIKSILV